MNIFRILASGKLGFREEFVSTFLAYLLSPQMDHGLGAEILKRFAEKVGTQLGAESLTSLAKRLEPKLRSGLEESGSANVLLDLEVPYEVPGTTRRGFIDLVIKTPECFILIENKITLDSVTEGQIADQYNGFTRRVRTYGLENNFLDENLPIIILYLLPAEPAGGQTLAEPTIAREELDKLSLASNDKAGFVTWQPVIEGNSLSFVQLLQEVLADDAAGRISPLTYDMRQLLLAFIDFAMNDFSGFTYQRVTQKKTSGQRKVSELLMAEDDSLYVGIQYGFAGLIDRAWKNPKFKDEMVAVSDQERGWQYLKLAEFKAVATWAMNPNLETAELLKAVQWQGMPFWVPKLFLVAKAVGEGIWIGIQGGREALETMTPEQIKARKKWQVGTKKKSYNWFSGTEFCRILKDKGINYDSPEEEGEP